MRNPCVYRFYDENDALLYVGMSCALTSRLEQHRTTASWWKDVARVMVAHFSGRIAAADEERHAIAEESPRYNRAPGMTATFDSLEDRRQERAQAQHARHRRAGMYRVPDLACTYCGWTGGWVQKGCLVSNAACAHCGTRSLTGTPEPAPEGKAA